jgi:hypothetical protein
MKDFKEFKKTIGYSCSQLENLTGYTRQGLRLVFDNISKGKQPNRRFTVCINSAISQKIQEETQKYESRMEELKRLKNELIGG